MCCSQASTSVQSSAQLLEDPIGTFVTYLQKDEASALYRSQGVAEMIRGSLATDSTSDGHRPLITFVDGWDEAGALCVAFVLASLIGLHWFYRHSCL